jgi:hypothetical protein
MIQGRNDEMITTLLRVPNTPEGVAFLKQMRRYAIKGTRIRAKGRGPRAKVATANNKWRRSYDQSIPMKYAEYFAVYIEKPVLQAALYKRDVEHLVELQNRITAAQNELKDRPRAQEQAIKHELDNLTQFCIALKRRRRIEV